MSPERLSRHDQDLEPVVEPAEDTHASQDEDRGVGAASRASRAQIGELLQRLEADGAAAADRDGVHEAAQAGVASGGQALPHLDQIQASFGHHDVGGVRAHVGGPAREAAESMGAQAFATGTDVGFARDPDLHTAAHEAAHVVQQQQGVQLLGGVGEAGDDHERHADAVADRVVRGESAEALLDERAGGAPTTAQVQRKITDTTIRTWEQNAANKTREKGRKREFDHITRLLRHAKGSDLQPKRLQKAVLALMNDETYAKYQPALQAVLDDLADQMTLSEVAIDRFVVEHLDEICPTGGGDRSDPRLRELRIRIVVNEARSYTQDKLTVARLKLIDDRGFHQDGQWGKKGYCEVAAKALGDPEDVAGHTNGSTIGWNHWVIQTKDTVRDPTWKQFFKLADTAGKPPIFEGTAEDFRALGLPEDDTRQYLRLVSLGGTKLTPEPKVEPKPQGPSQLEGNDLEVAPKGEPTKEQPERPGVQAGKDLKDGLARFVRQCSSARGPSGFRMLDSTQQVAFNGAAAKLQHSDPEAGELLGKVRDAWSALLQHAAEQPALELDDDERRSMETHSHYNDKLGGLFVEGADVKSKYEKDDVFKGLHQSRYREISKRYHRNLDKRVRAKQRLDESYAAHQERARNVVRAWEPFAPAVASYVILAQHLGVVGVELPDMASKLADVGLGLIRMEDDYGLRGLYQHRDDEIAEREYKEHKESQEAESQEE